MDFNVVNIVLILIRKAILHLIYHLKRSQLYSIDLLKRLLLKIVYIFIYVYRISSCKLLHCYCVLTDKYRHMFVK